MSADTPYWLVIGDADGSGTDYATLLRNVAIATPRDWTKWHAVQTTDGWASVRTTTGRISSIVAVFASGRVIGNPMTVSVTSANNQNRRGWRFVAPTTAKIFGLIGALNTSGATITGVELWAGDTGPSGSPQATGSVEALSGNLNSFIHGYLFGTAPTMTQGTPYRLVYTYGANANVPEKFSIGTGATAELRSARIGGGAWYFAGASGTTDWSNDDTNSLPNTDICVDDFLPSAQPTYVLGTI
jgi:hypothetical protein